MPLNARARAVLCSAVLPDALPMLIASLGVVAFSCWFQPSASCHVNRPSCSVARQLRWFGSMVQRNSRAVPEVLLVPVNYIHQRQHAMEQKLQQLLRASNLSTTELPQPGACRQFAPRTRPSQLAVVLDQPNAGTDSRTLRAAPSDLPDSPDSEDALGRLWNTLRSCPRASKHPLFRPYQICIIGKTVARGGGDLRGPEASKAQPRHASEG